VNAGPATGTSRPSVADTVWSTRMTAMTKNQGGSARVINRRSTISGAYQPPAISFRFMNKISLD
jgi:hypothetical protein